LHQWNERKQAYFPNPFLDLRGDHALLRRHGGPESQSSRKRLKPGGIVSGAGRTLRISGCVFYRGFPDPGICRSGDGAVSFHHHAARSEGGSTQENEFSSRLRRVCGFPVIFFWYFLCFFWSFFVGLQYRGYFYMTPTWRLSSWVSLFLLFT